eukprot:CAMPEP_0197629660 /NCGR_PEP_ID=MMETSP1338-20131121/7424_1 /TAXON_ID=43686 ORGANISM="Pelagodinium beii, Strain RCC1491" /NCGR_SAMPLE_ID=MMETSP1338 /ASSEMBLY_ACC=CAM_ASM_000754 /LENGTH=133 /DNA_ID=CAMNT_0043200739 /DNA_START=113 /DNA_END=511 /DNA_ORIENTATION=+
MAQAAQVAAVQQAVSAVVLDSLLKQEEELDKEIETLDKKLDEDDLEAIRRKRIEQMKKAQKAKKEWAAAGHGSYTEISDQKEFFAAVKRSKRVVCHFYRPTTWRCGIIDKHIGKVVAKHPETKFIKIDAEKSP